MWGPSTADADAWLRHRGAARVFTVTGLAASTCGPTEAAVGYRLRSLQRFALRTWSPSSGGADGGVVVRLLVVPAALRLQQNFDGARRPATAPGAVTQPMNRRAPPG